MSTTLEPSPLRAACVCGVPAAPNARFCKSCGGSVAAPPVCPACRTEVPRDARFCSGCGAKLVGARAEPRLHPAPSGSPAPSPAPASAAARAPTSSPDAVRELESLASSLPPARPRSSNIAGNVLMFVAALSVFVVVMYSVNKDAPKEVSPFMGGPAPSMGGGAPAPAQGAAPPAAAPQGGAPIEGAPSTEPIRGVVKVDAALASSVPSRATLFIIARNKGMPDRGPPIAVAKIDGPRFPQEFVIGPADAMMQMPFTGPFDLYVRLDADGNAMTKAPGDLSVTGPKAGVAPGATGVELVLDKRL